MLCEQEALNFGQGVLKVISPIRRETTEKYQASLWSLHLKVQVKSTHWEIGLIYPLGTSSPKQREKKYFSAHDTPNMLGQTRHAQSLERYKAGRNFMMRTQISSIHAVRDKWSPYSARSGANLYRKTYTKIVYIINFHQCHHLVHETPGPQTLKQLKVEESCKFRIESNWKKSVLNTQLCHKGSLSQGYQSAGCSRYIEWRVEHTTLRFLVDDLNIGQRTHRDTKTISGKTS